MNILYLTSRIPFPPHRGDRLTGYQLLRAFSRSHSVTLATFVEGEDAAEGREALRPFCRSIETVRLAPRQSWSQAILGVGAMRPSQVAYYDSPEMRARIDGMVQRGGFDAVFVQLFRMAPYVARLAHPLKVLFLADSLALSLGRSLPYQPWYKRPGYLWEYLRVRRYEPSVATRFRESWVLSDVDRRDLEERGCRNVVTIPHGVDDRLFDIPIEPATDTSVMFLGNLSVPHNVDAATYLVREIWPRVRARRPDARLALVGADAGPAVRALGGHAGVELIGAVPDLSPIWRRTRVLAAPLRYSSGIQNKVLEAMAAGVPVVTTAAAAEAIGARADGLVRVGADAEGIAAQILAGLASEDLAARRRAREHVRTHFSWEAFVQRLEALHSAAGKS